MHMNVAPHLLTEDRAEYERVLDDALRTAGTRPELDGLGSRLTSAQLRSMALNATALIAAAAASEYEHFVRVREQSRAPAAPRPPTSAHDGPGPGVAAIITVMVPVLAGSAAAIFLLVGAVLHALAPTVVFGGTLLTAGLVFGAIAAGGLLCAGAGLLVTALRNNPAAADRDDPAPADELSLAREAWRRALLERGILPFLTTALAATAPADPAPDASTP
ncbi:MULTISPECIES: hypothetical protein [unclassified Streptomyces]|uniref:hypothetical protein n=1 Tax=unclassified Streptomyces TaxID=2593676 RepID=UPI0036BBDF3A